MWLLPCPWPFYFWELPHLKAFYPTWKKLWSTILPNELFAGSTNGNILLAILDIWSSRVCFYVTSGHHWHSSYNLCLHHPTSNRPMFDACTQTTRCSPLFRPPPYLVIRMSFFFKLGTRRNVSPKIAMNLFPFCYFVLQSCCVGRRHHHMCRCCTSYVSQRKTSRLHI